jgi:hypothetical protein
MSCGSTVTVGRPSQSMYDQACATNARAYPASCSTGQGTCAGVDGTVGKRKNREKVREEIKDYVLLMLGAGSQVVVELDSQGLDLCVDMALDIFEDYASREYFEYYTFTSTPGVSVYRMPDNIGVVRNVYYKEQGMPGFTASDLGGAIPLEYFYPGGAYSSVQGGMLDPTQPIWGRMGEWVQYKMYENMFSAVSSQIGGWEWIGDRQTIKLYPTPMRPVKVIVHYLQKCKDFRKATQAMKEGAYAHALIMLGNIRGKYMNIPGPQGGQQIDGDKLRDKGYELKEKWQEELLSRYGDILGISYG